jgi:hypothetical protein
MEMREAGVSLRRDPRQSLIQLELNQTLALSSCLSMIFSENRFPLFRIML